MDIETQYAIETEARSPTFRVACVETATEAIGIIKPGMRLVGLTKGQFSMLDLMRAALTQTGAADVTVSTWTFGIRDIENARWLIDNGQIKSLKMLTDRSFAATQPEYAKRLYQLFGDECIIASFIHCKFALIQNENWNIAIMSSMNFNRNPRWEQFDIEDNKDICDFFSKLIDEMDEISPVGTTIANDKATEIFKEALKGATCGNRYLAEMTPRERMARLGYSRAEVAEREGGGAEAYTTGARGLEDSYREAVVSAALGGNTKATEQLKKWIRMQDV